MVLCEVNRLAGMTASGRELPYGGNFLYGAIYFVWELYAKIKTTKIKSKPWPRGSEPLGYQCFAESLSDLLRDLSASFDF